jgi:hypothetical protein
MIASIRKLIILDWFALPMIGMMERWNIGILGMCCIALKKNHDS